MAKSTPIEIDHSVASEEEIEEAIVRADRLGRRGRVLRYARPERDPRSFKNNFRGIRIGKLLCIGGPIVDLMCVCDCNAVVYVSYGSFKNGRHRSCGSPQCRWRTPDLAGMRFGRLLVLRYAGSNNGRFWEVECDCGKRKFVTTTNLQAFNTRSCGCLASETSSRKIRRLRQR